MRGNTEIVAMAHLEVGTIQVNWVGDYRVIIVVLWHKIHTEIVIMVYAFII